jgi:hypothetical protein
MQPAVSCGQFTGTILITNFRLAELPSPGISRQSLDLLKLEVSSAQCEQKKMRKGLKIVKMLRVKVKAQDQQQNPEQEQAIPFGTFAAPTMKQSVTQVLEHQAWIDCRTEGADNILLKISDLLLNDSDTGFLFLSTYLPLPWLSLYIIISYRPSWMWKSIFVMSMRERYSA